MKYHKIIGQHLPVLASPFGPHGLSPVTHCSASRQSTFQARKSEQHSFTTLYKQSRLQQQQFSAYQPRQNHKRHQEYHYGGCHTKKVNRSRKNNSVKPTPFQPSHIQQQQPLQFQFQYQQSHCQSLFGTTLPVDYESEDVEMTDVQDDCCWMEVAEDCEMAEADDDNMIDAAMMMDFEVYVNTFDSIWRPSTTVAPIPMDLN